MALGPYWPHAADAWSCGVCLLEMAGGLGSMCKAVHFEIEAIPALVAPLLLQYFEDPGAFITNFIRKFIRNFIKMKKSK